MKPLFCTIIICSFNIFFPNNLFAQKCKKIQPLYKEIKKELDMKRIFYNIKNKGYLDKINEKNILCEDSKPTSLEDSIQFYFLKTLKNFPNNHRKNLYSDSLNQVIISYIQDRQISPQIFWDKMPNVIPLLLISKKDGLKHLLETPNSFFFKKNRDILSKQIDSLNTKIHNDELKIKALNKCCETTQLKNNEKEKIIGDLKQDNERLKKELNSTDKVNQTSTPTNNLSISIDKLIITNHNIMLEKPIEYLSRFSIKTIDNDFINKENNLEKIQKTLNLFQEETNYSLYEIEILYSNSLNQLSNQSSQILSNEDINPIYFYISNKITSTKPIFQNTYVSKLEQKILTLDFLKNELQKNFPNIKINIQIKQQKNENIKNSITYKIILKQNQ